MPFHTAIIRCIPAMQPQTREGGGQCVLDAKQEVRSCPDPLRTLVTDFRRCRDSGSRETVTSFGRAEPRRETTIRRVK
eukprot:gene26-biopygen97